MNFTKFGTLPIFRETTIMPKKLFAILTVIAVAFNLFAAKDKDKSEARRARKLSKIPYYTVESVPETMDMLVKRGETITLYLEENPTTGYMWTVRYDKKYCNVDLKQRASKAKRVGAPGLVEVKLRLSSSRGAIVVLSYLRPGEKGGKPFKTVTCRLIDRYRHDHLPPRPPQPGPAATPTKAAPKRK